jgi:hypothetical protein
MTKFFLLLYGDRDVSKDRDVVFVALLVSEQSVGGPNASRTTRTNATAAPTFSSTVKRPVLVFVQLESLDVSSCFARLV